VEHPPIVLGNITNDNVAILIRLSMIVFLGRNVNYLYENEQDKPQGTEIDIVEAG
jgi:hypothetical protein